MNSEWPRIARLMTEKGMTWARVAEALNVSTAAMAQWKTGKTSPSRRTIFLLEQLERSAGLAPQENGAAIVADQNPNAPSVRPEHFPGEKAFIQKIIKGGLGHVPLGELAKDHPEAGKMLMLLAEGALRMAEQAPSLKEFREAGAAQEKVLKEIRAAQEKLRTDLAELKALLIKGRK